MLETLITSKTRIKLILKFFINPENKVHMRGLATEFNESTNAVRVELNRLTKAGLLERVPDGRIKQYQANTKHSLFSDIHNIVIKYMGIDKLIEEVLAKLGDVELALVTGDYARGVDSGIIDLVVVGEIDKDYLQRLIDKAESLVKRKIRSLALTRDEYNQLKENFEVSKALIVWSTENSN
ncbi:MAG: ArsR family transcriptional regulator [Clostridia bacterium]|nr:ArsR family transcriptional regulator [Clostridia bacterium]